MSQLRVLDPAGYPVRPLARLAERPGTLDGKVLWFVDGHGQSDGGQLMMNRIFRFWKERLEKDYTLAAVRWARTDNVCTPFRHGKETFEEIVRTADVVINGVAL